VALSVFGLVGMIQQLAGHGDLLLAVLRRPLGDETPEVSDAA
jgi:hypothetical protein